MTFASQLTSPSFGIPHGFFGARGQSFTVDHQSAGGSVHRGPKVSRKSFAGILRHAVRLGLHSTAAHCYSNRQREREREIKLKSSTEKKKKNTMKEPKLHLKLTSSKAGLDCGSGTCTVTSSLSDKRRGEAHQAIVDAKEKEIYIKKTP